MKRKTLLIGRHAKSSWDSGVSRDFDRPLNNRGISDLPIMLSRLIHHDISPDKIIHSAAQRTTETASFFLKHFQHAEKESHLSLYNNTTDVYMDVLKDNSHLDTVMLIGHNPTITSLVNSIGNVRLDNMPTCGLACFTFSDFKDLEQKKGELQFLEFPKMFK